MRLDIASSIWRNTPASQELMYADIQQKDPSQTMTLKRFPEEVRKSQSLQNLIFGMSARTAFIEWLKQAGPLLENLSSP